MKYESIKYKNVSRIDSNINEVSRRTQLIYLVDNQGIRIQLIKEEVRYGK